MTGVHVFIYVLLLMLFLGVVLANGVQWFVYILLLILFLGGILMWTNP